MDALIRDRRLRAFRATDAFAVEAYRVTRTLGPLAGDGLAGEIRRTAMRCGGAIVAATANEPGSTEERRQLDLARAIMTEGRYYLYLARRLGLLDLKVYRGLTLRQDAALRELDVLLRRPATTAGAAS
jgi:hypothetical protein